jgi:CHAT domain-containing protein/Flp pilus assembly protein TadD
MLTAFSPASDLGKPVLFQHSAMRTLLEHIVHRLRTHVSTATLVVLCLATFTQTHFVVAQENRSKINANRLVEEARRLRSEWVRVKTAEALKNYEKARVIYRAAGDSQNEVLVLLEMGDAQQSSGDPTGAAASYDAALTVSRRAQNQQLEASSLIRVGFLQIDFANYDKALECANDAQKLIVAGADRDNEAQVLLLLGTSFYNLRKATEARDYLQRCLELAKQGDQSFHAATLMMLGHVNFELGNAEEALRLFNQALEVVGNSSDLRVKGKVLNSLAIAFFILGQKQEAVEHYRKALSLFEQMGDSRQQALSLNGLAFIYYSIGQSERALNYYARSSKLFKAVGDREGESLALVRAAQLSENVLGKKNAIEYYEQLLTVARELKDPIYESHVLNWLGDVNLSLDARKALSYYTNALALSEAHTNQPTTAYTLNRIGYSYAQLGQEDSAKTSYTSALKLMQTIRDREGESLTLYNLAALEQKQNRLPQARELIERSLSLIESLTVAAGDRDLRASYFATVHQQYEFYIDVLMQLHKQNPAEGFDRKALEASEQSRARSLLEMLGEGRADIRQGVDPQLLAQESNAKNKLTETIQQQQALLSRTHTKQEADDADAEVVRLTTEYEQVLSEIRRRSPQYAALTQPSSLTESQFRNLVDDDSIMVEYALGDRQSYAWTITRDKIESFELPGRDKIENLARTVYEGLSKTPQRTTPESSNDYPTALESLSNIVLQPIAKYLSKKRVLVVADGSLQYIPFSILQVADGTSDRRLLAHLEVVNLPSGSALAVQRMMLNERKPASQLLAIVADPVVTADDYRITNRVSTRAAGHNSAGSDISQLGRTLRDFQTGGGAAGLRRLYFSGQEADSIFSLIPAASGMKKVGFEANRQMVVENKLANFQIVHFATHGLLDNRLPELSGIVFSMYDKQGRHQNGFLQLYEIYNLKLSADLVVLSACQTALGKDMKGEGVVGLTRGFMHAGARRVLATLWNVNDQASAELMYRFYREMLVNGLKPSAALRAAQLELSKQKRFQAPFYWAGFLIQGDWQ